MVVRGFPVTIGAVVMSRQSKLSNQVKSFKVRSKHLPLSLKGTIVDIETTNDHYIGCLGIVTHDEMYQYLLMDQNKRRWFTYHCESHVNKLPRPYYAFNVNFERQWFNFGQWEELNVNPKRGINKWRTVFIRDLWDPYKGDGSRCLDAFDRWTPQDIKDVSNHNWHCLHSELALMVRL